MSRRIAFALVTACAFSVAAQVRENVTVEVVEVPVYITSGNNEPVQGLTREAFELFVNGRPQPIEHQGPAPNHRHPRARLRSPRF